MQNKSTKYKQAFILKARNYSFSFEIFIVPVPVYLLCLVACFCYLFFPILQYFVSFLFSKLLVIY